LCHSVDFSHHNFSGIGYGTYLSVDFALLLDILPSIHNKAKDIAVWNQVCSNAYILWGIWKFPKNEAAVTSLIDCKMPLPICCIYIEFTYYMQHVEIWLHPHFRIFF